MVANRPAIFPSINNGIALWQPALLPSRLACIAPSPRPEHDRPPIPHDAAVTSATLPAYAPPSRHLLTQPLRRHAQGTPAPTPNPRERAEDFDCAKERDGNENLIDFLCLG